MPHCSQRKRSKFGGHIRVSIGFENADNLIKNLAVAGTL